jgi:RNA polymerase sigma-70 factor, ECF subfamily
LDEQELIERAKKGNKSALNTLLSDNLNILKGYVIKMTGDPHIAQDVIQDAMLKAVLNINKFEPKARFSTWLIKIATNVYRDYLRKNKPMELIEDTLEDKHQGVEDMALANYEYREIMGIIHELPPEKRSTFILKHYHGYKYEEIAEILNCPVGTVRSRLHNAVKHIISEMERKEII